MASNTIEGRAKKYDGTAIDYVSIFNWIDGTCIAQVKPNEAGLWSYPYTERLEVGVTYVANGCEPITHGAYIFTYEDSTTPIPTDYILAYDFNGDTLDKSVNALDGQKSGSADFVVGRKLGTQALQFVKGVVITPSNVPVNSNKLTVSFWISTNSTAKGVVYETTQNTAAAAGSHYCMMNEHESGKLSSSVRRDWGSGGAYNITSSLVRLDNSWQHVVIEIDTSQAPDSQNKIYVDNVLTSVYRNTTTAVGSLVNNVWRIGARFNKDYDNFNGRLQDFRAYNRILSEAERTALFNE